MKWFSLVTVKLILGTVLVIGIEVSLIFGSDKLPN